MPRQVDKKRRRPPADPSLRIGDAERNDVAEALSQHYSAGRLDEAELKERLDRAMQAKTGADLSGILTDLPSLDPAAPQPVAHPPRRHRNGLWIAVAVVLVLTAFAHGPWFWPWWMGARIPWILIGVVAFLFWRRSRRRHWHAEASS